VSKKELNFRYLAGMNILLLAAPYDSGHHKKRLGLGPLALIDKIEEHLKKRNHTIHKEEVSVDTIFSTEVTTSFEVVRQIAKQVRHAKENNKFPIVLTGNCNAAALGTLSGLQDNSGMFWFDCHGDFNTPETTVGGYLDGMSIAMVVGHCWTQLTNSIPGYKPLSENKIILAGARDFDVLELQRLSSSPITLITPELFRLDASELEDKFIPMESIYLHIDLDVLDPQIIKANGFSTEGGISPEQLIKAVTVIKNKYTVAGLGITAYDPSLDPEGKMVTIVQAVLDALIGKGN
jgi:arginase